MLSEIKLEYFRRHLSQALITSLLCLILFFLASASTVSATPPQDAKEEWLGTVRVDSISVYSEASTKSKPVGSLQKGDVVIIGLEIVGEGATWYSISSQRDRKLTGYVRQIELEQAEPPALESWNLLPPPPTPEELALKAAAEAASQAAKPSGNRSFIAFKRNEVRVGVERFFLSKFGRSLPISAFGQTALHGRLGFNHNNAFDVAVHPDSVEGRAIMSLLRSQGIPFIAFRGAVRGVATGPHIHVGNPSPRR